MGAEQSQVHNRTAYHGSNYNSDTFMRRPTSIAASTIRHPQFKNTSHVDPATGSVLPTVNPLARIPARMRIGQKLQVIHNQSSDPRGDADHIVGAVDSGANANPRAWGALMDRQALADQNLHDRNYRIPIRSKC
jgi:hypothetical protein